VLTEGLRPISQDKLEQLFKIVHFDKASGKWKHKKEASEKLGLSRPTIDKWLAQYSQGMPEKPHKTEPKYFQEFAQTECAAKIKELYYDRQLQGLSATGQHIYGTLREAWRARIKKDPLTFDLEDFLFFFGTSTQAPYPSFVDPLTNKISFNRAVALRTAMRIGKARDLVNDPKFTTLGLKREAGRRKAWYLEEEEIIKVVNCVNEPDTLMMFYLGLLLGGRFGALQGLRVGAIHRKEGFLTIFESKIAKRKGGIVEKDMFDFSLEFVWQYIIDFDIKERLFEWDIDEYNERFKRASNEAGLPKEKEMTSHMFKHTCITQMSLHDVDIDVISEYVKTDAATIMQFYRGGGREKIRAQILDLPRHQETWKQFVLRLHSYFVARYNHIKPYAKKVDGIKAGVK
jgi:integrase